MPSWCRKGPMLRLRMFDRLDAAIVMKVGSGVVGIS